MCRRLFSLVSLVDQPERHFLFPSIFIAGAICYFCVTICNKFQINLKVEIKT